MTPSVRAKLVRFARGMRGPAIVVVVYLALRSAFAALTEDDGLLTPEGAPNLGVALLGVLVLGLRLVVVVLLPAVIAWRAARAAMSAEG